MSVLNLTVCVIALVGVLAMIGWLDPRRRRLAKTGQPSVLTRGLRWILIAAVIVLCSLPAVAGHWAGFVMMLGVATCCGWAIAIRGAIHRKDVLGKPSER